MPLPLLVVVVVVLLLLVNRTAEINAQAGDERSVRVITNWNIGCMLADASGQLYVCDENRAGVSVLSSNSGELLRVIPTPSINNTLWCPSSIAWTPTGNLLLTDGTNSRAVVMSLSGEVVNVYGSSAEADTQLSGVAAEPTGDSLFVTDYADSLLLRLSSAGQLLGATNLSTSSPTSLFVDSGGSLFAVQTVQGVDESEVLLLASDGSVLHSWQVPTRYLSGLAVSSVTGDVYMCDNDWYELRVYSANGTSLGTWHAPQFWNPIDVAVDDAASIVSVLDSSTLAPCTASRPTAPLFPT